MKSYCKEPYALIGHVRFCEGQKLEVKGGNIQMKNLGNAGKAHNTIYIYIFDTFTTSGICLLDHTHTHKYFLVIIFCFLTCNFLVAGVDFCTQNLIEFIGRLAF